jgi:putative membrane protein
VTLAPEFADRYLGQQGDAWDAHQDMALAAVGAVISVIVAATVQRAKGGSESLAVDIRECEPQPTAG